MHYLRVLSGIILFVFMLTNTSFSAFYTVRSGDSLIRISKRLGIKPEKIKSLNPKVNWLRIRPGDKLIVPVIYEKNTNKYIVQRGDSLIKISKTLNISPKLIKQCNPGVNWLKIRPKDKIVIPFHGNCNRTKTAINSSSTPQKNISLNSVVKRIDIKEIKKLNPDINWDKIKPDNSIKLAQHKEKTVEKNKKITKHKTEIKNRKLKPGEVGNGYYIVSKGDTLNFIAHRFGLTLKQLMKLNPQKNRYIRPGELIVLPGELTKKIMLSEKENLYIPPKYLVYSTPYKIKKGDSLWGIANRFKTKIYVLRMLNNLSNSYTLKAGRIIFVPNKNMLNENKLELEYSLLRERRNALISYAERFLGRPYRFGGNSLIHGIDCSAFVQKVYGKFNIKVPRTAQEQYSNIGVSVPLNRIQVGDLLFFHTLSYAKVTHVGIYIGKNHFIHAAGSKSGIKISKLNKYYKKRFVGAKRIFSSNKYVYSWNRSG